MNVRAVTQPGEGRELARVCRRADECDDASAVLQCFAGSVTFAFGKSGEFSGSRAPRLSEGDASRLLAGVGWRSSVPRASLASRRKGNPDSLLGGLSANTLARAVVGCCLQDTTFEEVYGSPETAFFSL